MKRCPECRRDYYDETLLYCLDDGTSLVEGPASMDDPATAILSGNAPKDAHMAILSSRAAGDLVSINSICVLPFVNMSADPENEYFCDGLAEELLNALAKIEDLKVAARTSTFTFKSKNIEISEIGRALNVSTILEGSVRK